MTAPARIGVIYDVDGVLRIAALRHPMQAARGLRAGFRRDRRSVLGMAGVLQALAATPDTPVFYLTGAPRSYARSLARLLVHDGYPSGSLVMARTRNPLCFLGGGRAHKQAALEVLVAGPEICWVLVGDDGLHDPDLYTHIAGRYPDRVAAIALRRMLAPNDGVQSGRGPRNQQVPVLRAPNGEELLPLLRDAVGLEPRGGSVTSKWLLTAEQRGNAGTALRAWTEGNAVRALVHGRSYFPVLAKALAGAGAGDQVSFAGWRGDTDELLAEGGPTVGEAFAAVVRRGVLVRGLMWWSHLSALQYSAGQNRRLAQTIATAGGAVLLDQRIHPLGSHHQKLVVLRHPGDPGRDVGFVGGIDLARGRGDDARHAGDPQPPAFAAAYGATPAWHDVQLQLRGPAVGDVEELFRERWADPTALSRLPWHVLPDLIRGLDRTAAPLPPALPDPPAAGTCAVQLLRTYPRRWPRYRFAPRGERSVARAYAKALHRARRIVYIEDQYLWSVDVARVFATALKRAPWLQLIAVVPRYPDQESPLYLGSARSGQSEADPGRPGDYAPTRSTPRGRGTDCSPSRPIDGCSIPTAARSG